MSTYTQDTMGAGLSYRLSEQDLYGSSRIGMYRPEKEMIAAEEVVLKQSDQTVSENEVFIKGTVKNAKVCKVGDW
jgi:hypothetical protein